MYYVKVDSVAACLLTLFFFFSTLSCPAATSANGPTPPKPKPNIFLVLADDLDERLGSVPLALNNTLKYFSKHGTIFENAFVTTPVCCPSRSSMLSGLYAHNHGALTNNDECNGEFWKKNIEHKTIGVRMQQAGYQTAYIGKYLNNLNLSAVPPGWDHWFVQRGNSKYYNFTMVRGSSNSTHGGLTRERITYSGNERVNYFTSVIQRETAQLLEKLASVSPQERKPMFAIISLPASHGRADAEPQYRRHFAGVKAPRTPNFNVRSPDKHWIIRFRHELSETELNLIDFSYRRRLQTLRSVDDFMTKVFRRLNRFRLQNNSYVFFTSDHGFHLGQFAQLKGKNQPYEEDTRVPMFAVGPGVPKGNRVRQIVLNIDLAPTFVDIAKVAHLNKDMDGASIMMLLRKLKKQRTRPKMSLGWRTSFLITKFKHSQQNYEDNHLFLGRWGKKSPQGRTPSLEQAPARRKRIRDPGEVSDVRLNSHYQLPRQRRNITVTTNTTVTMRAAMVVKLVRWMKHSGCRPIQRCTLQYLRAERISNLADEVADGGPSPRQRSRRAVVPAPVSMYDSQILSLLSEQEACNCTPPALENACTGQQAVGWKCNRYAPCRTHHFESEREQRRCQRAKDCKKEGISCQLITPRHWRTPPYYTGGDVCHCANTRNSSYWCERRIDEDDDYLFCHFVTGFGEFFDMRRDPWQMNNKHSEIEARPSVYNHIMRRLSYLRTCSGHQQCSSGQFAMTSSDPFWTSSRLDSVEEASNQ
eukprot:scpid44319/ scgid6531/ Extracellular sulfatase Sulf-2